MSEMLISWEEKKITILVKQMDITRDLRGLKGELAFFILAEERKEAQVLSTTRCRQNRTDVDSQKVD